MKITSILIILLSLSLSVFSQSIDDFKRIKSEGPIPDFFTKYLDEKIEQDNEELSGDGTISARNARDFTALTNYKLEQLIQSGRVLYGDPLTEYANDILDNLKKYSKDDLDDVQLYTLKSNEVNAFATHQGVIFITVGLWGQIENEAQLAFIIAHELTHVVEKHSQLSYQHTDDRARKGRYGDDMISTYYQYSKDNEEECDKKGFKLALKAGYNAEDLYSTFNVLLYSYLPIDEMKVDYSWIENDGFKVIDKYLIEELNEISAEEDVDDEFHTHPNIYKRRVNIKTQYNANKDKEDTKTYVAGTESDFLEVRELARFEMMNIFIRRGDYIKGLYHNLILTKTHPNNSFVKNTQAMVWYGLSAFTNGDVTEPYTKSYRKVEGEIQALYYTLYKMKNSELATLAAKQIWEASLADTANTFLQTIRVKALREMARFSNNKLANFASEYNEDGAVEEEIEEDKPLSKYDKIAKKKKKGESEDFAYYALINLINNNEFIDAFDEAVEYLDDKEEQEEESEERSEKPQESSMDVKSLIMTTPNFYKKDNRKTAKQNVSKNDLNETKLVSLVEENADKLGIKLSFIDNFKSQEFNTEMYNDFSLLYDYLGERSKYDGLDFYPYGAQDIGVISEKYGSSYVGMIGIYTEVDKRDFNSGAAVLSALTVYLFPLYLKWQLTTDKYTDYGFVVYNLDTHNPAFVSNKFFNANMNIHLQNAHIYNSLNQITK